MKKLISTIFFVFFSIYAIVVFTPKKELYYFAETIMSRYKVYISNEELSDYGLMFRMSNGDIFYDGISGGKLEDLTILLTLFYNKVELKNIIVSQDLKDFVPGDIRSISATNWFLSPHIIDLNGEGDFGDFTGEVNLISRNIHIQFKPSTITVKKFRPQLRFLKRSKEGYTYDYSF